MSWRLFIGRNVQSVKFLACPTSASSAMTSTPARPARKVRATESVSGTSASAVPVAQTAAAPAGALRTIPATSLPGTNGSGGLSLSATRMKSGSWKLIDRWIAIY